MGNLVNKEALTLFSKGLYKKIQSSLKGSFLSITGGRLTGDVSVQSGKRFIAGDKNNDAWSGFLSYRYTNGTQIESSYGTGLSGGKCYAQVCWNDITDPDKRVSNRVFLDNEKFFAEYHNKVDLGSQISNWKNIYANTNIVPNWKLPADSTGKGVMIFNNGNTLAFSRLNGSTGAWLDDMMTMDYSSKKVSVKEELEAKKFKINGKAITISSEAPTSPNVGDIWISI